MSRRLIHRMVVSDLEDDQLDLQWRGPSGGIEVVVPDGEAGVFAWKRSADGSLIGDPVLFVGAERVGAVDTETQNS